MKIGEVSKLIGLSSKAIRHYHDIGLVVANRGDNGYREYTTQQLQELMFVARSKALGFSLEQCAQLLSLDRKPDRTAEQVRTLVNQQLVNIREKVIQLQQLESLLDQLVTSCQGGSQAHCSILDALNSELEGTHNKSLNHTK